MSRSVPRPRTKRRTRNLLALLGVLFAKLIDLLRENLRLITISVSIILIFTFDLAPAKPSSPASPSPASEPSSPRGIVPDNRAVPWDTIEVQSEDDSGRRIRMRLVLLNEKHRWLLGSTKHIGISQQDTKPVEEAVADLYSGAELPIVVVGMASHENAFEHPDDENDRALTRADELAAVAERHFYKRPPLYKLNLGAFKHAGASRSTSSVERRVALLEIVCRDPALDMNSGIRNALLGAAVEEKLSFDVRDYTNFDVELFRVQIARSGAQNLPPPPPCTR